MESIHICYFNYYVHPLAGSWKVKLLRFSTIVEELQP